MNDAYNFTSLQQPMSGQYMGQDPYYGTQQFGMMQDMSMGMGGMPNNGMTMQNQNLINSMIMQGYMVQGMPMPQMGMMNFDQQKIKTPPPTTRNVQGFLAIKLQVSADIIEFVQLSEPFFASSERHEIRHACKLSLTKILRLPCYQVQYFDKAMLDVAYCSKCLKVYYYIEKYDY